MKNEPTFTASRLALLARLDRRAVERKLAGVPCKTEGKARHYTLAAALPALCREPADAEGEARMKALREREQAANTQAAELANLKEAGEFCFLRDAKLFWSEGFIAIRQAVQADPCLSPAQRIKVLARIVAAKPGKMPEAAR